MFFQIFQHESAAGTQMGKSFFEKKNKKQIKMIFAISKINNNNKLLSLLFTIEHGYWIDYFF